MKYPLATIKQLCDEYSYDICLGYNERTFCCSNELTSITHLATLYHWHQHIDEHFHFP